MRIRSNFRMVSVLDYMKQLMNDNPKLSEREARNLAAGTSRNRSSRYEPHYGTKSAARNLLHKANGTHGY